MTGSPSHRRTDVHAECPGRGAPNDVDDIVRLLLSFGADPNQRGINDFTPLHMAVSERNAFAIQLLLDAGADPDMPTRIDECESAVEMAQAAGLHEVAAMLARKGQPLRQRLRSGLARWPTSRAPASLCAGSTTIESGFDYG